MAPFAPTHAHHAASLGFRLIWTGERLSKGTDAPRVPRFFVCVLKAVAVAVMVVAAGYRYLAISFLYLI